MYTVTVPLSVCDSSLSDNSTIVPVVLDVSSELSFDASRPARSCLNEEIRGLKGISQSGGLEGTTSVRAF